MTSNNISLLLGLFITYLSFLLLSFPTLRCETSADACNPDPCQNNGSCQQENGGFKCNCTSTGFVGQICDVSVSTWYTH